jgi:transketolase
MYEHVTEIAKRMRGEIMKMLYAAGSGHPGASLSSVDILAALFFEVMKHDPSSPNGDDRDRFFLSKGHAAPALYAALALSGYFPPAELKTLRKIGSRLQGHPNHKCPGVEVATGSLGQGFSIAAGVAWALGRKEISSRVFALLGDGECNEGIVWEAALFARHHQLANLTAIIDCNGYTNDGLLKEIMDVEPFMEKWQAFGWETVEINGHDIEQIVGALSKPSSGSPRCVLARTVKGKGVRYLEKDKSFHTKGPTLAQMQSALRDIG